MTDRVSLKIVSGQPFDGIILTYVCKHIQGHKMFVAGYILAMTSPPLSSCRIYSMGTSVHALPATLAETVTLTSMSVQAAPVCMEHAT